jgi:hypothetical protein
MERQNDALPTYRHRSAICFNDAAEEIDDDDDD